MSETRANIPMVRISLEASVFNRLIDETVSTLKLYVNADGLPGELRQSLVNFLETPAQLFRIDTKSCVTGGTTECLVCLKPSEGFLDFASALRTWKRNGDIAVKHDRLPDSN